ncbi:MAG: ammonium transporter [Chloroflexi bacterium]|nr:ammonium transporter [Chloroflexota bacterium]
MPELKIDTGDTAWLLISTALVMLMTPALAFFYGGLVRKKNVISTIMHSFFILALVSVMWVLWGYTLAFGPDAGGFGIIGGLDWFGLNGVGLEPNKDYGATVPHQLFMAFQMMFAVITPALITGAFAERKRFKAFVIFTILWSTLVYSPLAHWVWGVGGWLRNLGALDFAGGTVVHISSGTAALICALVLGKRLGFGQERMEAHDVPMVVKGAGLLWFGWFGFNAGSAIGSNGLAVSAFVVTHIAAAAGALTWSTLSWIRQGQPSVSGAAAGAVAGLVAITPASGYVNVSSAIIIGMGAGLLCYGAVILKTKLRFDDALDVWAVHGVGGMWGAVATGLFATVAINPAGANGLFYGSADLLWKQFVAVGASVAYSAVITFVILKVVDLTVGLRVGDQQEALGLDLSQHGERAYI